MTLWLEFDRNELYGWSITGSAGLAGLEHRPRHSQAPQDFFRQGRLCSLTKRVLVTRRAVTK